MTGSVALAAAAPLALGVFEISVLIALLIVAAVLGALWIAGEPSRSALDQQERLQLERRLREILERQLKRESRERQADRDEAGGGTGSA